MQRDLDTGYTEVLSLFATLFLPRALSPVDTATLGLRELPDNL